MIFNEVDREEELEALRIENGVQAAMIKAIKEEVFEIADERDKARGAAVLLLNLLKKSYWSESICQQVSSIIERNKWLQT